LEKHYYSNINLFDDEINDIQKYKSIFIDEIQDYKVEWIRIIKKYFLEENGEFIVFGDEKQNIYDRTLLNDKTPNTTIIGRWNKLKESFRLDTKIAEIAEKFSRSVF
jgi:superfamily I DNA/RNA helicase